MMRPLILYKETHAPLLHRSRNPGRRPRWRQRLWPCPCDASRTARAGRRHPADRCLPRLDGAAPRRNRRPPRRARHATGKKRRRRRIPATAAVARRARRRPCRAAAALLRGALLRQRRRPARRRLCRPARHPAQRAWRGCLAGGGQAMLAQPVECRGTALPRAPRRRPRQRGDGGGHPADGGRQGA